MMAEAAANEAGSDAAERAQRSDRLIIP
jgi:hypothetical protein